MTSLRLCYLLTSCEKPLSFLLKSRVRKWVADCSLLLKRWSPTEFCKHHFYLLSSFVIKFKLSPSFQSPWIRFCLADFLVLALILTWSRKNATYWAWLLWMSPCRFLCYFTVPGAGFHAGCGRNYVGCTEMWGELQTSRKAADKLGHPLPVSDMAPSLVLLLFWYQIQWVSCHTVFPVENILQRIGFEILLKESLCHGSGVEAR